MEVQKIQRVSISDWKAPHVNDKYKKFDEIIGQGAYGYFN
jgi:hypothetical protein